MKFAMKSPFSLAIRSSKLAITRQGSDEELPELPKVDQDQAMWLGLLG